MLYHVRATFKEEKKEEFRRPLTDGTIASIKPEGGEILASMQRAVLREDRVEWTETCFFATPLRHERMVVYDEFFTDFETDSIDAPPSLKGKSFWEFLGLKHETQEK